MTNQQIQNMGRAIFERQGELNRLNDLLDRIYNVAASGEDPETALAAIVRAIEAEQRNRPTPGSERRVADAISEHIREN
jgi:hypothetical protein